MIIRAIIFFSFLFVSCTTISLADKEPVITDTLIVGYRPAPPFIMEGIDGPEGISVWLWKKCAQELKLNYEFRAMDFGAMLDSVRVGSVDVSINPLTITSQRLNNMYFTHPFYASHSVVVKGERSPINRFLGFFRTFFSFRFWSGFIIIIVLILIFGILVWFFERREINNTFRDGWPGIRDGIWWAVVTMTTVGYGRKTPQSRGGKAVAVIWMFSGLLFISGLTASVASTLTVEQLNSDTSNFMDFKDRKVGTIERSSSEEYLRNHFFKEVQVFTKLTDGLDAIKAEKIDAFIYDEPIIRYMIFNESAYSSLTVLPNKFGVQFYGFGLSKNREEILKALSQEIVNITERDEWQRVLKEYGVID